jgi:flagellar motor switch protein FliM
MQTLIEALRSRHEGAARGFAAALSGLLRSPADVKLTAVQDLAFSRLSEEIRYPTCLNVVRADPLPGQLLLELKLDILFPIIDRLLGGGREPSPILRRPLTEIELRLAARVTSLFLEQLRRAWSDVVPLRLSVERVESDPHSVGWVKSAETHQEPTCVVNRFEIILGQHHGALNLYIPTTSLEPIRQPLLAGRSNDTESGSGFEAPHFLHPNRSAAVELVAQLAETKLAATDLVNLQIGDIIATDHETSTPIIVTLNGAPKFHAHLGAYKGRKAVQIEGPVIAD